MQKKTVIIAVCLLALAAVVLTAGCVGSDQTTAKDGDTVSVYYTLIVDGAEKESNVGKEPISFTIGDGHMIKGFNDGIIGMKVGETKTVKVSPENGYGVYSKEHTTTLQLADVKKERGTVSVGDKFPVYSNQMQWNAEVLSIDEAKDTVTVAVNHPFAGKDLTFVIKLDSISAAQK